MRVADVNLLVFAHRVESPSHAVARDWLEAARVAPRPLGLADVVMAGFVRVVTNRRIFREPASIEVAFAFLRSLLQSPSVRRVHPGERHWDLFTDLCRTSSASGNLVTDAYIAAIALELGAALATTDRDFARFEAVRIENPLVASRA